MLTYFQESRSKMNGLISCGEHFQQCFLRPLQAEARVFEEWTPGPMAYQACAALLMLGCGVLEENGVFGEDTLLFLYATSYVWLTDDPVFLRGVLCSYHNLVCYLWLGW